MQIMTNALELGAAVGFIPPSDHVAGLRQSHFVDCGTLIALVGYMLIGNASTQGSCSARFLEAPNPDGTGAQVIPGKESQSWQEPAADNNVVVLQVGFRELTPGFRYVALELESSANNLDTAGILIATGSTQMPISKHVAYTPIEVVW